MVAIRGLAMEFPGRGRRAPRTTVFSNAHLVLGPSEAGFVSGANGAGKTTLLKCVGGLLTPTAGDVTVCGFDNRDRRARRRLGFASSDERSFALRLSGRANLRFFGRLYGLSRATLEARVDAMAHELALERFVDLPVHECSTGVRSLLGLVRALMHEPDLLLLDEPTRSLDADRSRRVLSLLRARLTAGAAILATSHDELDARAISASRFRLADGRLLPEEAA